MNESMKKQEQQFLEMCKKQLMVLEGQIANMTSAEGTEEEEEERKRIAEVERRHAQTQMKYNQLRQLLAEKNRTVVTTSRLIDDHPTRTELIQYERRFTELYDQTEYKLGETRKYFDMYNTLFDKLGILRKQVEQLNAIDSSFDDCLTRNNQKEALRGQIEAVNNGLDRWHESKLKSMEDKSSTLDGMTIQYNQLQNEQRKYFKAVKEFQEECLKNEKLIRKIDEIENN